MVTRMVAFNVFPFVNNQSPELNLNWSLRPITMWTKFFGIPLFIKKPGCRKNQQFSWIPFLPVCLVFYFSNLGSNAYITILASNTIDETNQTTTKNLNYLISEFNLLCLSLTTHTTLVVVSSLSWMGLPDALSRLEEYSSFGNNYKRFRRIFSVGSLIISLVNR